MTALERARAAVATAEASAAHAAAVHDAALHVFTMAPDEATRAAKREAHARSDEAALVVAARHAGLATAEASAAADHRTARMKRYEAVKTRATEAALAADVEPIVSAAAALARQVMPLDRELAAVFNAYNAACAEAAALRAELGVDTALPARPSATPQSAIRLIEALVARGVTS